MAIHREPNTLHWRVVLNATPQAVFAYLSTDGGRRSFWAEASTSSGDAFTLTFPDRSTTTVSVLSQQSPDVFEILYFGAKTRFTLQPVDAGVTVLHVTASPIAPEDLLDVGAGWVSVLLNLKCAINCGRDLRNHHAARTWADGYVDN